MPVNKVVYGTRTLIDLSSDTVTAATLSSGYTAHDKAGNRITGTLTVPVIRTGTTVPSNSLGSNGDTYLKLK